MRKYEVRFTRYDYRNGYPIVLRTSYFVPSDGLLPSRAGYPIFNTMKLFLIGALVMAWCLSVAQPGALQEYLVKAREAYKASPEFWNIQGLAFSDDGRHLFIADYVKGIFRLDLRSKTLALLYADFPLSLKSIDGLTFCNNSLVAIQNLVVPMRVTQYFLNSTHDRLTGYSIIDRAHPAFNEPTTGCRINDTFYYIANSLWSGYDQRNRLKPTEALQDVVILKAKLKE